MSLAGKTIFITGASRGIGKAIALRAAKDGANIAIAAKTTEPHPKLDGTIYTAAEEIDKAGGKGLPLVCDIRYEEQVEEAVQKTAEKFGGIDILVNNASAISLTPTVATPMKRYDLMNQINTRGTFLCSQKCIPYLSKSSHAHILNISPPLSMKAKWFAPHVAYTIAKFGMSMCVLGMAEELKGSKIGVNALWPKTVIWTAAVKNVVGAGFENASRKPEIMADAAYEILTSSPAECTGNFFIDEELLGSRGVTDFDQYAIKPGTPLQEDFFLPD